MAHPSQKTNTFGPYELLEKLGRGGMGSVFRVRRVSDPKDYALKIAGPLVIIEPTLMTRFQQEFAILRKFAHPGLVEVYEEGEENGHPYFLMEYIPGGTLQKYIKDKGPLSLAVAVSLAVQLGAVLTHLHENGLFHRDIKPANVLMRDDAGVKLADMGLAKDVKNILTQTHMGMGTLEFAAPEQIDDAKTVDHRCDIYGLAATFYYTVTGKNPFGRVSPAAMLYLKQKHKVVRLGRVISCDASLDDSIFRALSPNPKDRQDSIAEFVSGLRTEVMPAPADLPDPLSLRQPEQVTNRRSGARHIICLETELKAIARSKPLILAATILDLSVGGLCLKTTRRFEKNVFLEITLPQVSSTSCYVVQTRWTKTLPEGGWALGCEFVRPVEEHDLQAFLQSDACRTLVLKPVPRPR